MHGLCRAPDRQEQISLECIFAMITIVYDFLFLFSILHYLLSILSGIWLLGINKMQVYIVLVSCELNSTRSAYLYLLNKVLEDIKPEDALIYSYRAAACGFAAKLTQKEAKKLQGVDGVLEVIRSMTYHLDDGMSSAAFIDGPV
ncbi:hypothetical protein SLE2022_108350 [Rubroshorea leprosula]